MKVIPIEKGKEEKVFFINHPFLHFFVQFFLVCHVLLSSIRGIIYIFSFIIFEEKLFFNFVVKCCFKDIDLEIEVVEKDIDKISKEDCGEKNNKENNEELNHNNIEMNNNDFYYNKKE